uniref:CSC1/OSCA1-like 7TM region domain-containing protein n=1 Tax=Phaeomonas parva TaxID=124430 RepID=A0A7S1UJQ2_9STRA|mmetsp:Transcript_8944/g.25984  ORF Transcript_8944/g.25984 Transcript_8944/m.25984 type:complete len:893 (+) Transcript_8944:305-2983(+)|eukprot:CAMPEP_0118859680 /NCGR_PEP_ID=MMETSP1163-20130328/5828_1 /TAXON_ID=124430 /ORGANISM="Phaeomonas parva, Strain CCMP2877" /LENGTH=892 /DNA_ID=CAMNT_0006793305 /DNA_START=220 /DNA_END=2898 /DNA_ORIENTATION=-
MAAMLSDMASDLAGMLRRRLEEDDDDETAGQTRGWIQVFSTLQIAFVIGFVLLLVWEFTRKYKGGNTPVYNGANIAKKRAREENPELDIPVCPERPTHFFGWVTPLRLIDGDKELLGHIGLDAYVVLRYLKFQTITTAFATFMGAVLLIPVYETAEMDLDESFYRITISNLEESSHRFWACAILPWVFFLFAYFRLTQEYENFVQLRHDFITNGFKGGNKQTGYTILVENLPKRLRTPRMLFGYFDYLFPGQVYSTSICMESKKINGLLEVREDVLRHLETLYIFEKQNPDKAPVMISPPYEKNKQIAAAWLGTESTMDKFLRYAKKAFFMGPPKVSKVAYLEGVLDALNGYIQGRQGELLEELGAAEEAMRGVVESRHAAPSESAGKGLHGLAFAGDLKESEVNDEEAVQQALERHLSAGGQIPASEFYSGTAPYEPVHEWDHVSATGFVTFRSFQAKEAATQVLLTNNKSNMQAFAAPEPNDVIWHDIHQPLASTEKNRGIARTASTVLTLFFSIPVAACAAASLEQIERVIPPLEEFSGNYAYTTLGTYLPTIASLVLLMLVPIVFKMSAEKFEFYKSDTAVQAIVFARQYNITLAYVYISLTSGSVFDALADIIDDPVSILSILANTIPGTAAFFMNVVIVKTFQGIAMEMCRIVPFALHWFFSRKGDDALGKRDLLKRDKLSNVEYGTMLPNFMMTALIGYLFEIICPAMSIFAFAYFFLSYLCWKHQFLYVYARKSESGGSFFFPLFDRTIAAMMVGQLTIAGFLFIRLAFWPGIVAVVLPMVTYNLGFQLSAKYQRSAENLSFEKAVYADEMAEPLDFVKFSADTFSQPALKNIKALYPNVKEGGESKTMEYAPLPEDSKNKDETDDDAEAPAHDDNSDSGSLRL